MGELVRFHGQMDLGDQRKADALMANGTTEAQDTGEVVSTIIDHYNLTIVGYHRDKGKGTDHPDQIIVQPGLGAPHNQIRAIEN